MSQAAISQPTASWSEQMLLSIFRRFPPSETIFKESAPRAVAEYTDEVSHSFEQWFPDSGKLIAGRDVLDLGCGYGGRPVRFAELGARSVTGVEISEELVSHARQFAHSKAIQNSKFLVGTGEGIPTADGQFDLITMFDVMEHVVSPAEVLRECWRVLRPGGQLAVVFPPYYSLRSGSHLHGYATRFPGLNLCFSTRTLKNATLKLFSEKGINYRRYMRDLPTDKLWNMNGLTIRRFHSLVRQMRFSWDSADYIGEYDRRLNVHHGLAYAKRLPIYLAFEIGSRIPLLREALCGRVCALLRKR